jgi:4-hydroxy-3-methylbut-2-enyl diphosphate reductase
VHNFLPAHTPARILITSGASCPDALVEQVIDKMISFYETDKTTEEITANFTTPLTFS